MARRISVDIVGDSASLERAFKRGEVGARGFQGAIGTLTVGIGSLAKSFIVIEGLSKAFEGLKSAVDLGIEGFKETQRVQAQTVAALKSTGGVANISAEQIRKLGLELSNLSGIDDEVIRGGENVLLAFQNIRNFAGKGSDIFTEATKASVDFAIRSGRSVQAASVAIGRALQDPAKAAGSLRRAYVVLTVTEKAAIAAAVAHGDILKAQRLIVADLEKRYGGAAAAAGKTLPGALNILKERFKDLAGEGIGTVAPALTKAAVGLAGFVRQLTEAHGASVKFHLVLSGLEHIGQDILGAVEKQISSINFSKIADEVGRQLARVNWREKIAAAGRAAGDALVASLDDLRKALASVDWNKVGQELVKGISLAIAAFVDFLAHVNWNAVADATMRLVITAFKAAGGLLLGVGEALGKLVLSGITKGLDAAGAFIEKKAIEIVLKIVEPFSHLPAFLGGGPFQDMKKSLQATLDQMAGDGRKGGHNVGAAVAAGIAAGVGPASTPGSPISQAIAKAIGSRRNFNPADINPDLPTAPGAKGLKPRPGISAAQRNTFFDNSIGRILSRGGLGSLKQQLAAILEASALVTKRLAATKDVTRKLNLEDQVLQLASQAKGVRQQIAKGIADRLKAQRDAALALRTARQFETLGLSSTGQTRVPIVATLNKQLANVSDAVSGTFLDTTKTKSVLANIKKVLSAGIGNVSTEVRAKIKELLDGINKQLQGHNANLTKFRHQSSDALLAGLGLSPETIRALKQRLAQVGAGGTVPGGRSQSFALAGAGAGSRTIVIQLDGREIARSTEKHQRQANTRRAVSRSGPYAGRN